MIVPDVNLLLYAVNVSAKQHRIARDRLQEGFHTDGVGFPMPVLLGFLRLSTRQGIFSSPLHLDQALAVLDHWVHFPTARSLVPTPTHLGVVARLLSGVGRAGPLVSDADIAAYAITHSATLVSFDRDFLQFSGLHTEVLVSPP